MFKQYFQTGLRRMLVGSLVFAAMTGSAAVTAESADMERLSRFYKQVKSLQATFVQRVDASGFSSIEESAGVFYLQRPGRFRWDYTKPYKQQIIADGKKLWVYDVDMDQVIVKKLDLALGSTPAVLLSGTQELKQQFTVDRIRDLQGRPAGLVWLRLLPKDKESNYQHIVLGFNQDNLEVMELLDNFGQATVMRFSDIKRNPNLDASLFQFTPPLGVDVIGAEDVLGQ
ncbi:MAG: outer membrane lipoprotein chaperone LolA [Gammaproteobacteria bacterium]|nr:outer membrane lipoprotein chaperone LolA [Gammaproteobacteria bacterium]MDH5801877.1 outer membrane lipoprotein chaperone LolA [Gammaproteobacteria bacterium]